MFENVTNVVVTNMRNSNLNLTKLLNDASTFVVYFSIKIYMANFIKLAICNMPKV